jgi:hypothetical protein
MQPNPMDEYFYGIVHNGDSPWSWLFTCIEEQASFKSNNVGIFFKSVIRLQIAGAM